MTRYDKVVQLQTDGSYKPPFDDIEAAKTDCDELQECL